MNKKEFMELLDYYFRNVDALVYKEIKDDYEEHFNMGVEEGKTEEEISRSLGSPREIYNEFKDSGVFSEDKKGTFFENFNGEFFADIADKIGNVFTKKDKEDYTGHIVVDNEKIETPIHRIEIKVSNTDIFIENHNEDYIEVSHTSVEEDYDFTVFKEGTTLKVGTYDTKKFDINKYFSFGVKSPVTEIVIKLPMGNEANISISTESGDSKVYVNKNNINFLSATGDLDLESNGSTLKCNCASGDMKINGIKNNIDINTISGKVDIVTENPEINVDTVSGDFNFDLTKSNNLNFKSVSGDITGVIRDMDIYLKIDTVSGEIFVNSEKGNKNKNIGKNFNSVIGQGRSKGKIQTVSGSVKIKGNIE